MRVLATKSPSRPANWAPGEVIVKLKQGAPQLQNAREDERLMTIARLAGEQGESSGRSAEELVRSGSNERISQIISGRGLDRVFVLKLGAESDVPSIVSELRARDDVEYAEPNYLIELGAIPNDPNFYQQWALLNNGIFVGDFPSTLNADIKAPRAWDITLGNPDVIIAISDTGVDLTHPDLARNIYTNPREIPDNGIDDDHNGFIDDVHGFNVAEQNGDTTDAEGHGTLMAGIIAAEINNGIGISGVCQSKIMPVRFYKRYGPGPQQFSASVADAARSLLYAIAAGASIINASWSTLLDSTQVPEEAARALRDAVSATNDAGVLLVCIAGNQGFDLDYSKLYPASYFLPNQIVVAASDFNDEIWRPVENPYFIQTGFGPNTVNLAAPGVSVLTTQPRGNCSRCTQDTDPTKWYTRADGTSVSAAFVSGVAALVKSRFPGDNALNVKKRIIKGVEIRNSLSSFVINGGRLSAEGALRITPPTLTDVGYKAKKEKLTVYGSGMEEGLTVFVGNTGYPSKPRSEDGTVFLARVPASAFPAGTPVQIKLRNTDGGESQTLTLTR